MKNLLNMLPTAEEWASVSLNNSKAVQAVVKLSKYVESNFDALFEAAKTSRHFNAIPSDYYAGQRIQHAHSGLRLNRSGIKYCPKYEDWRGHKSDTQAPVTVVTVEDIVDALISLYNEAKGALSSIDGAYDESIRELIDSRS